MECGAGVVTITLPTPRLKESLSPSCRPPQDASKQESGCHRAHHDLSLVVLHPVPGIPVQFLETLSPETVEGVLGGISELMQPSIDGHTEVGEDHCHDLPLPDEL
jgi:hypothetical protein